MHTVDITPAIRQTLESADRSAQQLLHAFQNVNLTPEQLVLEYAKYVSDVLQEPYIDSIINTSMNVANKLGVRFPKQSRELWGMLSDLQILKKSIPTSDSTLAEVVARFNKVLSQSFPGQIVMIQAELLNNKYSKEMWFKKA